MPCFCYLTATSPQKIVSDRLKKRLMVPKIIHYCWLSDDPFPEKIQMCIESWKKVMPDYELKLWNTQTFDIENSVPYVREAFANRKWAFVADYIRLYALYTEGGFRCESAETFR